MNVNIETLGVNYASLLKKEPYLIAYNQIKSNPGNMTPGTDGETLDGIGDAWLETLVEDMKSKYFKFKPSRRTYILKANGQKRPLGIPSPRDKIVQKALLNLLEPEYESKVFLDSSHGFRPNRGCHTAINSVRKWQGITWVIEGDIKSYFDTIDHDILGDLLKRRISDQSVLELYRKLVKAGYVEGNGIKRSSWLGVPQGGLISPFLSNVYLHELDVYMQALKEEYDTKGEISDKSKTVGYDYVYKVGQLSTAIKASRKDPTNVIKRMNISSLRKVRNSTPSRVRTTGRRIHYVRYADDWLIGVIGPLEFAQLIKTKVANFLADKLKVELNLDKTKVTHIQSNPAYFLGFKIQVQSRENWDGYSMKGVIGKHQRMGPGSVRVYCPMEKVLLKLESEHFVENHRGIAHLKWINLPDADIIMKYRSMMLGLYNYYHIVDNPYGLQQLKYVLTYSAASTLAAKHKQSLKSIMSEHGSELSVNVPTSKVPRSISMELPPHFKTSAAIKSYRLSKSKQKPTIYDPLDLVTYKLRSNYVFDKVCSLCQSEEKVENHHVRHLKDLVGNKDPASTRMMSLNRKQIPLCRACHMKIHSGRYDGIALSKVPIL